MITESLRVTGTREACTHFQALVHRPSVGAWEKDQKKSEILERSFLGGIVLSCCWVKCKSPHPDPSAQQNAYLKMMEAGQQIQGTGADPL